MDSLFDIDLKKKPLDINHGKGESDTMPVGDSHVPDDANQADSTPREDTISPDDEKLIRFLCPNCHQRLAAPEEMLGDFVQCPSCSKTIKVARSEKTSETHWVSPKSIGENNHTGNDSALMDPIKKSERIKVLTCELCGSTDLIKQNGVFMCQSCGTKYSLEDAKKMMNACDTGSSGASMSDKLKNLYILARRAKNEGNSNNAAKYYDLILLEAPEDWEAIFYGIYFKAYSCKISDIVLAAQSVTNCLENVINLIIKQVHNDEKINIYHELTDKIIQLSQMLGNVASNHFSGINIQVRNQFTQGFVNNMAASADICYNWGNLLDQTLEQNIYSCNCWEFAIDLHKRYLPYLVDKEGNIAIIEKYADKIRKSKPSYNPFPEGTSQVTCDNTGNISDTGATWSGMSERLKNFYILARRAKDEYNSENAILYYHMILLEDPENWEASFYETYFKAYSCAVINITTKAQSVTNCLRNIINLIVKQVPNNTERIGIYQEITEKIIKLSQMLGDTANNHFRNIDFNIRNHYGQDFINNMFNSANICYTWGDLLEQVLDDHNEFSCSCWETAINLHKMFLSELLHKEDNIAIIEKYANKIRKIKPSYNPFPEKSSQQDACYIATAIYGSYDCPEVWTLRRYRDDFLGEAWVGRIFIKIYYSISPTIVKYLGGNKYFQYFWRKLLDRLVKKLNAKGFSSLPYNDRRW